MQQQLLKLKVNIKKITYINNSAVQLLVNRQVETKVQSQIELFKPKESKPIIVLEESIKLIKSKVQADFTILEQIINFRNHNR